MEKHILKKLFYLIVLLFNICYSQDSSVLKTHLFLGTWAYEMKRGSVVEKWENGSEGNLQGKGYFSDSIANKLVENLNLRYIDGKLTYCATVINQNNGREICFPLKEISGDGKIFVFENLNHDFPQRIIYDFTGYNSLTAIVEDSVRSDKIIFKRVFLLEDIFELRGKIIKEQFENKAGRKIEGVYDYFFEIEGEKYFIKLSKSLVENLKSFLDRNIRLRLIFQNGLWDADDNNVQSRIGTFIIPVSIIE
jgi:hypothetical protein